MGKADGSNLKFFDTCTMVEPHSYRLSDKNVEFAARSE